MLAHSDTEGRLFGIGLTYLKLYATSLTPRLLLIVLIEDKPEDFGDVLKKKNATTLFLPVQFVCCSKKIMTLKLWRPYCTSKATCLWLALFSLHCLVVVSSWTLTNLYFNSNVSVLYMMRVYQLMSLLSNVDLLL